MRGRRSVWSDKRLIEISKKFVVAADEVWRLQRGTDPECALFRAMADKGHYGGNPGATRQGIYVCAPSGEFLASINSNRPEAVLEMIQRGLTAWKALPKEKRSLAEEKKIQPKHRWEDSYPEGGLNLQSISRDLPSDCRPDQPIEIKWNIDYAWFTKGEARSWLPPKPKKGDRQSVPQALVERLARFHLLDAVRGQTSTFWPNEIESAKLDVVVTKVAKNVVTVDLEGMTRCASERGRDHGPFGVATQLRGSAKFDLKSSKFTSFELVALGQRWGRTRFNGRYSEPESSPIGFVLRLAADDAPRVAPAVLFAYRADWVKYPQGRSRRSR